MNVIKQFSCRVTQLRFERGSTCKVKCYIAPCNSINILTLAQKLLLQALLGTRRSGRAQKGTVLNKGIKCNLTSSYIFLFAKLGLTTCIIFEALNSAKGRD